MTGHIFDVLEEKLKRHDWYYSFSDDHRYWVKGQAERKEIENLMKAAREIDEERANALYARYSK